MHVATEDKLGELSRTGPAVIGSKRRNRAAGRGQGRARGAGGGSVLLAAAHENNETDDEENEDDDPNARAAERAK